MKSQQNLTLFTSLIIQSTAIAGLNDGNTNEKPKWGLGKEAVITFNKGIADNIDKLDGVIDTNIHTASDEINKVIVGAAGTVIAMLKTEIATAYVAAKTQAAVALTATKVAAIGAAPYVAGGAAVVAIGYGGYKLYQSGQPSEEKFKTQLQNCLFDNKNGPFNKHRIPEKCTEEYKNFAIWAGDAKAQDKVEAFKKCS